MPKLPVFSNASIAPDVGRLDVLVERAVKADAGGNHADAIQICRGVLRFDPTHLGAINCLGAAAGASGDLVTAMEQFANSLRIDPTQPEIWFNLSVGQSRLGLFREAMPSIDRALALSPNFGAAHLHRGTTLERIGRYREAVAALSEAAALMPNDTITAKQRGLAMQWSGDFDAAFREFDRALALQPDHAEAWVSKAFLMLLQGDLANGLPLYEWRWRMAAWLDSPRRLQREYTQPLWLGETDIAGKTILIHPEQGFGDVFQFCRYATLAANAGARVIVEVDRGLAGLMATLPGVAQVTLEREPLPDHDFHCPMMSLPLAFGTTLATIPAEVPYLRADPALVARWRERLSGLRGRRIGLVWGAGVRIGDAEMVAIEQRKSLPLTALGPLAAISGCEFVSIQLGPAARQAASPPPGMVLHDHTADIQGFADTAALMENLDLIISVCTSTAHLAGALGRPVWLLNRFDTDWRWFLDRADSPWYPTMRVFRQPSPGDWRSVVQAMAEALREAAA